MIAHVLAAMQEFDKTRQKKKTIVRQESRVRSYRRKRKVMPGRKDIEPSRPSDMDVKLDSPEDLFSKAFHTARCRSSRFEETFEAHLFSQRLI